MINEINTIPGLVSVIMPAFNCERFIAQAIESVLAQTYGSYEVIIVDDGSTDRTADICQGFVEANRDKIFYVRQENGGPAAARNTALSRARGEFIALLDADDQCLPGRLKESVEALSCHPKAVLVHGNIAYVNEEGSVLRTAQRDPAKLSGHIFRTLFFREGDISCPTAFFRRSVLVQAEWFDESRECVGVEDRDLWLRITHDHPVCYLDQVLAYYRICSGSVSADRNRMLSSRMYVLEKIGSLFPDAASLIGRAKSRIFRDQGDEDLLAWDYESAKSNYLTAIRAWPWALWPWLNLLKTLFRMLCGVQRE